MKTWLFVPGHNAHMLEKALDSEADVVIVDWEDAVPPTKKEEARVVVRETLTKFSSRPRLVLRINGIQTLHYARDLAALEGLPITGIMLPKVSTSEEVQDPARLGLPLIPTLESALGVENAFQIAMAHPLVERLALGSMDLIADMGAQWRTDGECIQYPRMRMLMAGRAASLKGSLDGVYPRLGDLEGLRQESITALRMGYEGKLIIHPEQIDIVRDVFTPTPEEVIEARETIDAFDKALAEGKSAIRIGERFIDPPMVLWAKNVLRRTDEKFNGG